MSNSKSQSEIVTRYNRITSLLQVITEEHLRLGVALQKLQEESQEEPPV